MSGLERQKVVKLELKLKRFLFDRLLPMKVSPASGRKLPAFRNWPTVPLSRVISSEEEQGEEEEEERVRLDQPINKLLLPRTEREALKNLRSKEK